MIRNQIQSNELVLEIAHLGRQHPSPPPLSEFFPFRHYLSQDGSLMGLDEIDGLWTRREVLTRFLLLSAVLDQGPDLEGVRLLVKSVVNDLYRREIRIFHKPLEFFREFGISIDRILQEHDSIKEIRADDWARVNKTSANKYNLFLDNSKQALNYAVSRWGTALCLPLLLEKERSQEDTIEPLVDYFESWPSAEIMSQQIKDHRRYGLGKAIGDKAGHLFAKWYVYTFRLVKRKGNTWGPLSHELPLDSNVGRVLFRTGFLLDWASIEDYERWNVIQRGKGKGGLDYLRVTNIRGKKSTRAEISGEFGEAYKSVVLEHLAVQRRVPTKIEIQRIPNALLLDSGYAIGDLDDGLVHIGTNYCFNHDVPRCTDCPINGMCRGYQTAQDLITRYRT
ncbi:MAG: hypothetical protein H5T64_03665 [Chloroflexi bacterium]|nr:hypothetical protein [Chloroflexota bacterium]